MLESMQGWATCVGLNGDASCNLSWGDAWLPLLALPLVWLGVARLRRAWTTFRGVAPTPAVSRLLARLVRTRSYGIDEFLAADGADDAWVTRRRAAFERLQERFAARAKKSSEWQQGIDEGFSDLRFADANRVPPAFGALMRERFDLASVVTASKGPRVQDLDGHWNLDVGGSYGVNVAGYDAYKHWIEKGWERVKELGPVLGPLHPVVAENVKMLKEISGGEEVSFHTSGTEAVMAAARMARFNTKRKLIVCFSGAYHGWWDGVQPGIGNERQLGDCLTLKDLDPAALEVIRKRKDEIAGVLVNPVQSFHPNAPPPNDAVLLTSEVRKTEGSTQRYRAWLQQLRAVCTEAEVPLIFDEVYSGFRLAPGGAQEFFDVRADMVLYGKTVAGGMPIGVVCGKRDLMTRFDPDRPMRIAYVVGTFSAHPLVMATMNEFLQWVTTEEATETYAVGNDRCDRWVEATNHELAEDDLPIRIMNLGTVWTVLFKEPSRYNWLLQYYLRLEGLQLSWVGTGRCLASLDYEAEDFDALRKAILTGARTMKRDGWWPTEAEAPGHGRRLKTRLARELAGSILRPPEPVRAFHRDIMERKHDDHEASHSDLKNQTLHLLSSSVFIVCYGLVFFDVTMAMCLGLGALFFRQAGHAVFEPPCHDKEKLLLGFTTPDKTLVVGGYVSFPIFEALRGGFSNGQAMAGLDTVALHWLYWTLFVVLGRVVYLIWKHGFRNSMLWFVKLVTDPFTDIVTYSPRALLRGGA